MSLKVSNSLVQYIYIIYIYIYIYIICILNLNNLSRTCKQLQLFIQIYGLELLSYKFELIPDEPVIALWDT